MTRRTRLLQPLTAGLTLLLALAVVAEPASADTEGRDGRHLSCRDQSSLDLQLDEAPEVGATISDGAVTVTVTEVRARSGDGDVVALKYSAEPSGAVREVIVEGGPAAVRHDADHPGTDGFFWAPIMGERGSRSGHFAIGQVRFCAQDADLPAEYQGYTSDIYSDDDNWLCKPGIDGDVCDRDLDATAVFADGRTELRPHVRAEDPAIDCFYVYPTISGDMAPNSDLDPAESEEIYVVYNQAARYTGACAVYAPVYRQRTLPALLGTVEVPDDVDTGAVAYGDVVDAFRHYISNDSAGRGFVLIGHSQGAGLLRRLVAEEIEPQPALARRVVSAHLLGSTVAVPYDDVVGGSFTQTPLCERADQTGCVVTYASFRETAPPPPDSLFASASAPDRTAGCVNPAAPSLPRGESAVLEPYFLVTEGGLLGQPAQPFDDPSRTDEIATPWVTYPDFVSAACERDGEFTYLSISVMSDPSSPRTDDIGGDLTPPWGLHLVDVNVAMGDLVALAESQAGAYTG